jgi:rhomboid family GlyGly-CTERM serine protease
MNRTLVLLVICAICLINQLTSLSDVMTWDKARIISGEWWRILSGNLTHTNMAHALMNLSALGLISVIFRPSPRLLALLVILLSLLVGTGLMLTELNRYAGLSGTLHGLFIYCALQEALNGHRSSWLLVGAVLAKVSWEQIVGPSQTSVALINAPVAIDAHLFGILAGALLIILLLGKRI